MRRKERVAYPCLTQGCENTVDRAGRNCQTHKSPRHVVLGNRSAGIPRGSDAPCQEHHGLFYHQKPIARKSTAYCNTHHVNYSTENDGVCPGCLASSGISKAARNVKTCKACGKEHERPQTELCAACARIHKLERDRRTPRKKKFNPLYPGDDGTCLDCDSPRMRSHRRCERCHTIHQQWLRVEEEQAKLNELLHATGHL